MPESHAGPSDDRLGGIGSGIDGGETGPADGVDGVDEVDGIVRAWRRELPGLDTRPLEVLSRVTRLARHLDRTRSTAFARHGLETWEFDVLAGLRRSGPPYRLSPGQLVALTMVTSGTMTNRLDRLAARDLLRRGPDPADGRGVIVELSTDGGRLVDAAIADLVGLERDLLAGLTAADQAHLGELLRELLTRFPNR